MQRRAFLHGTGVLVVAFASAAQAQTPPNGQSRPVQPRPPNSSEANPLGPAVYPEVDSWLAIDRRGRVTVLFGKVELGTGVQTSVAQLAADELYVPFERITVVQGDTARTPDQGYTAGSQTLSSGAIAVRQACGVARAKLLELGAAQLHASPDDCATADGAVFLQHDPSKRVTYAELIGGKRFDLTVPKNPPTRPQATFQVSGTSVPRVDIPGKIYGTFTYVQDVRLPGMRHARVIYPPAPDTEVDAIDRSGLASLPKTVQFIRRNNFLAVVAENEWDAIRGAQAVKVTWRPGKALPAMEQLPQIVRETPGGERTVFTAGDAAGALQQAAKRVTTSYSWPFQSHGSIGPSCAVADVRPNGTTVWSATQGVFPLRGAIAEMLGLSANDVRVIYVEGAGCYGHNGADDAAAAAALLSQIVRAPVRVQYMRVDETRWDPKGPAMVIDLEGALDAQGRIAAWVTHVWSPTHSARPDGKAGNLLPALLAGTPLAPVTFVGEDRDEKINYQIPAQALTITDQKAAVLRPSALRGLGGTQNTFANESFMDELAHAANADPLEFRLAHLTDARERAVLEALRPYAQKGRGLAWVHYENEQAIVGAVADVTADRATGNVRVNQLWIAHDCGMVVNPDGLRNQIEGNAIQAASRALLEEVHWEPHEVTSVDWRTYPILRFGEIPAVNIQLLDHKDARVTGAGEATTTVIAPAIANAIFAQTGVRVRTPPFTPQRVRATS